MISKGQKINDRYQIIRTIGEGGMANVYLAYDTILDRNVAVKILRGDLADDEKFVRRFQREAIAASSLSHQNVVEMYDVGEDDGKYFIVMEYIEGRTLKSLIKRRGALSLPEVVDIMLQLTSGISCAHNSYIIHRDIKPQNVLILDDGRVKITDFGIAMALNNELTQTNSVMGSVHYLPPEQANGNGSTNKSDIYSLGILMFELITGKLPFKGDNAVEIAIKQMKEQIPSITRLNPSIPQSVENVILKACAKNPKNRYDSAAAMHEDIKTVLDENREDEHRVIYMYPEEDLDSTKTIPNLESVGSKRRETSYDKQEKNKNSKKNKPLIILASIFVALIAVLLTIFFIIPTIIDSKEIVVPSVANMSVANATKKLEHTGFVVNKKLEKEFSLKVTKNEVIRTNPQAKKKFKKGKEITLIISKGKDQFKLKDYTGYDYSDATDELEKLGIEVNISKKQISDQLVASNKVIEQLPAAGKKIKVNSVVTLYIPEIVVVFPDFVSENWSVSQVKSFCSKHGITLTTGTEETDDYEVGTIISQTRAAGTNVASGSSIKIVIAAALPEVAKPTPVVPPKTDQKDPNA
ncbi:MAG: Stk1 family PASTA domain-containing Ser/Thr kinase [Bacilli bacterium]